MGYDTESAFDMLDDNGDGVLTTKEIQDGMAFHNIKLEP
jgi:Ca2+-binding EF-hand superfamily protein